MTSSSDNPTAEPVVTDAFAEFEQYVVRNMPPNTIISDPEWWADRLWRAAERVRAAAPSTPSGDALVYTRDATDDPNMGGYGLELKRARESADAAPVEPVAYWVAVEDGGAVDYGIRIDNVFSDNSARIMVNDHINDRLAADKRTRPLHLVKVYSTPAPAESGAGQKQAALAEFRAERRLNAKCDYCGNTGFINVLDSDGESVIDLCDAPAHDNGESI